MSAQRKLQQRHRAFGQRTQARALQKIRDQAQKPGEKIRQIKPKPDQARQVQQSVSRQEKIKELATQLMRRPKGGARKGMTRDTRSVPALRPGAKRGPTTMEWRQAKKLKQQRSGRMRRRAKLK